MQIKRLELQGFKSFKDKTVIHFDDGITGIVGPNGCGKSNVVDAFFWVMGEQNARLLRGQSMDDLIFSGADKAPPAGFAEVTLTLEMPAELSGPNVAAGASIADAAIALREVAITRKLYRTGESEYFINKVPCRLRDIQELFMDTGVGARGYSIIQQGQIAKLVQAKPEDRRTMIEEVAGIVKYKTRRRESLRKLEGTQQNLLRVTDVLNELETQKRLMERQAEKARKYKEWKERLQVIELQFNALKWEDLTAKSTTLELEVENLSIEDAALSTARESVEVQISSKRLEATQASKISEEFQQSWMQTGQSLNNTENEYKYSQKNLEDLRTASAQLERDASEEKALVEALQAQLSTLQTESTTIDSVYEEAELARLQAEEAASTHKRDCEALEKETETLRQRLYQIGTELDRARSQANFAQMRLEELRSGYERISSEKTDLESALSSIRQEKELASLALQEGREKVDLGRQQIQSITEKLSATEQSLEEERRSLASMHGDLARTQSHLNALEEQKRRHEGGSKGVKTVFQKLLAENSQLASCVHNTLADVLAVEKGMETAVETALGRSLDLILTTASDQHANLSQMLRQASGGRAAFADIQKWKNISANAQNPQISATPLLSFVKVQENSQAGAAELLAYLAQNVFLANDSTEAQKLSEQFPEACFVTREGELFRGGWFMEGGDLSSVSGAYVARNREIQELGEKLAELQNALELAKGRLIQWEEQKNALVEEKRMAEEALRNAQGSLSQLASSEASLQARVQELERSLQKLSQEFDRLHSERSRLEVQFNENQEKSSLLALEQASQEERSQDSQSKLGELRLHGDALQAAQLETRVRAASILDQKNTMDARLQQAKAEWEKHSTRVEQMLETSLRKQAEATGLAERIEILSLQIEEQRQKLVEAEQNYREAKERMDLLNHEVEEQRSMAQVHATKEREVKEALMKNRLELERVTVERDNLAQNTFEKYGLVLAEYSVLPETQEQVMLLRNAGEAVIQDTNNEVMLLKEKIRKLGDVNPAAVEEYEAIIERYNLLSTQKADLEKSMNDLNETIEKINHVSKERFERAFHEVNNHFKRVFPVIFGGGNAHLTLTNPEDLLETGVDITAQPPGKKPQNINLLSGGEKTLTAISLLFSVFLVKPSPFCLLDEVDAPLDDANIGRFNALLREMSKRSQFIIITHNKRTMELNDKLYGVTMEDAGVSKMVSIQLSASA